MDKFCNRFANRLIWVLIFIYIFAFCYLCFLKYHSFGYYDWDLASDVVTYWNSAHGKMCYFPFLEEIIFGAHLYLIMFLIIPIYTLFQNPLTVLFLQALFLGLAAYPLYLLAKTKLDKTFALGISLAYLLYPALGYINLFETHFDIYAVFFLFFAIYFFEKENFNKFLIFVFLAISCKENVSLIILMFGIYALLRKRSKRWILAPFLVGIAWFLLALKVIIPYFAKDAKLYQEGFMFSVFYKHLGNSMLEMVKRIIVHPIAVAKFAFVPKKILYLFKVFVPTAFIGFLSPGVLLIALPIFMQNLLSAAAIHTSIRYHYVALLMPAIFWSVVLGFKKLMNNEVAYKYRHNVLSAFLLISIVSGIYLNAPQLYFAKYLRHYKIDDLVREKNRLIEMIPKEASVISTFQFLPKLASRYDIYSVHFIAKGSKMFANAKYEPPQNLEYALIDFNEPVLLNSFFPPQAPHNIRTFIEEGNWRVFSAVDDIVLFKKDYQKGHKLFEEVQSPNVENAINVNIDNKILFLGYDAVEANTSESKFLHITYYWKRIGEPRDQLGFFIQFLDADGNVAFTKVHIFGYRVYLPKNWPKDKIFKEHHYVLIPSDAKIGLYNVRAGLFRVKDQIILPVVGKTGIDSTGLIILGNLSITAEAL